MIRVNGKSYDLGKLSLADKVELLKATSKLGWGSVSYDSHVNDVFFYKCDFVEVLLLSIVEEVQVKQ